MKNMKKVQYIDESVKFKVKRHWVIWVFGIFFNLFAVRFAMAGIYLVFFVILIADFIIILPEASHFNYVIEGKCLTVKRLVYTDIVIPCSSITAIENATLFSTQGFAPKINEWTVGAYKITYSVNGNNRNRKRKAVVISPKEREKFINEIALYIDPKVLLINNVESTFKYKKDKI
jgi:hypothetical protein